MTLGLLTVGNLRSLRHAELELHPGRNLIVGANGSGKTSLLEAIFLLGRGRSFRTRNTERLITHGQSRLVVFGRTLPPESLANPMGLGVQVIRGEPTVAKIQGQFVRTLAELSTALPVQVIDPGVHKLVEDSAFRRRRWMDWGTFHVEHDFVDVWAAYTRTLKQRNAALKQLGPGGTDGTPLDAWDQELVQWGEKLALSRRRMLDQLRPYWQETVVALAGLNVELGYFQGWARDVPFSETLRQGRERDLARGSTQAGPHRGDVVLKLEGRLARDTLSRGQQKLVAVSLILAQLRMLAAILPEPPTLLLDDPAAELDSDRLRRFIDQVKPLGCQLVLTSLTAGPQPFGPPDRMFHVEQGSVRGA
ncbi:MAG TPA: DNA replication/repair protein RecF [Steroidobacteraceae bacterium]|nr:DNA replication/repair protein RecF [Steroidobacteraceae bacterium]